MGQSHSTTSEPREIPIEQLSHELALRFATKCYTHLEIVHFKDNFKSLADHQDDVEYWKEETLCRFLGLPDVIHAGPVLYQMATYLGSFPFPSLAPCILTREAMLKVLTLLTGRYKKVLKRGDQDKIKLLFRSMAVFDRRMSSMTAEKRPAALDATVQDQQPDDHPEKILSAATLQTQSTGFAVDEPMNDDEDEDDDDLALAALDALDAIEVFKQDQRMDRKIHHAHIPGENLKKLIMLTLLFGPLTPQDNIASYCEGLEGERLQELEDAATALLAAFDPSPETNSVTYSCFIKSMTMVLPNLFRPLSALFEHFLFSKTLDLSRHQANRVSVVNSLPPRNSPIYQSLNDPQSSLLTDTVLAQLASSIEIASTSSSTASSFFHRSARFNELYSTASHGTSLSSLSRQVLSWRSASLLLLSGTDPDTNETVLLGAYLPTHWKDAVTSSHHTSTGSPPDEVSANKSAALFLLRPRHAIFRANPYNRSNTPSVSYFSSKTGIALGCIVPQSQSRVSAQSQLPIPGPVSLLIDSDISTATFQHDGNAGTGAFLTDPRLEEAQRTALKAASSSSSTGKLSVELRKKVSLDIDGLEIWGVSFADDGEEDEMTKQKKRLAWEEAEAARRRGVNFGGDKDGAKALLEMAGIVGDSAGNRTGGSMG